MAWSALLGKALLTGLLVVGCTPVQLPQPDPRKGEVILLQKQLLELQKLKLETKTHRDESTATIDMLSVKIKAREDRQSKAAATQTGPKPVARLDKDTSAAKKKPATRLAGKKKIRRQE